MLTRLEMLTALADGLTECVTNTNVGTLLCMLMLVLLNVIGIHGHCSVVEDADPKQLWINTMRHLVVNEVRIVSN